MRLVARCDAPDNLALFRFARNNDARVDCAGRRIESQIRLALFRIGTMAGVAMVGKDRADLAVEFDEQVRRS